MESPSLKRSLGLLFITFYGLGTIVGAGIYVLIGEVAGVAGIWAPLAFLIASILAAFSALSYAELSARFPLSAGVAVYLFKAFGTVRLSQLVGLSIVAIGIVSCATLVNGIVGYTQVFIDLSAPTIMTLFVVVLTAIAIWGMAQSAWVATVTTLIELGGLLLVLAVAGEYAFVPAAEMTAFDGKEITIIGVLAGAFIAFYAFIGFEDIINAAEEVHDPTRNLPRAVLLSLAIATALYLAVAWVAVRTVATSELAASAAPLALVYERATGHAPGFIAVISIAAIINGALIQIVMSSRVLYGMSRQRWLPSFLSLVHPSTRTPVAATLLISTLILAFALWLPLLTLAQITSLITLLVFAMVNLALLSLKRRGVGNDGTISVPRWVPLCGALVSLGFVVFQVFRWLGNDG